MWHIKDVFMNSMYSQQGQGFHAVPQDQTFQQAPEVQQVQFCQQAPLLQLLPVKQQHSYYLCIMIYMALFLTKACCMFPLVLTKNLFIYFFTGFVSPCAADTKHLGLVLQNIAPRCYSWSEVQHGILKAVTKNRQRDIYLTS